MIRAARSRRKQNSVGNRGRILAIFIAQKHVEHIAVRVAVGQAEFEVGGVAESDDADIGCAGLLESHKGRKGGRDFPSSSCTDDRIAPGRRRSVV